MFLNSLRSSEFVRVFLKEMGKVTYSSVDHALGVLDLFVEGLSLAHSFLLTTN